MESLGRPPTSLSDLLGMIPLVLEVGYHRVPVIDFIWDGVERHDPLHKQSGDSGSEEADQDIMVCDTSASGVTLEGRDVTFKGRGELSVLSDHAVGGQPGDSIPSCVLMFESCLEFL